MSSNAKMTAGKGPKTWNIIRVVAEEFTRNDMLEAVSKTYSSLAFCMTCLNIFKIKHMLKYYV